jgi:hypothetical protein
MSGGKGRALAAAVPLLLVNGVAFGGQLAFLRDHLPWPLAGQVTMAVALESVAVFLAMHAHVAALADDSALRLRLASYGFAAVIGAMNYSHYAGPGWRPTFPAVAVGLMSASSPWLWAVHSRRVARDQLRERGLIEPHALRLGVTRWAWHPLRSARVMWHATWAGVTDPREAIAFTARSQKAGQVAAPVRKALPGPVRNRPGNRSGKQSRTITSEDAEQEFAADIAAGQVPSLYQIRTRLHVGNDRAKVLRQHIARQALTT